MSSSGNTSTLVENCSLNQASQVARTDCSNQGAATTHARLAATIAPAPQAANRHKVPWGVRSRRWMRGRRDMRYQILTIAPRLHRLNHSAGFQLLPQAKSAATMPRYTSAKPPVLAWRGLRSSTPASTALTGQNSDSDSIGRARMPAKVRPKVRPNRVSSGSRREGTGNTMGSTGRLERKSRKTAAGTWDDVAPVCFMSVIDVKSPQGAYQSPNTHGTITTVTTITSNVNGTPTLTKSAKRYWPGPSTKVLTGDDTGVMNAAEAARATVMANG